MSKDSLSLTITNAPKDWLITNTGKWNIQQHSFLFINALLGSLQLSTLELSTITVIFQKFQMHSSTSPVNKFNLCPIFFMSELCVLKAREGTGGSEKNAPYE
jgi:hypothetical protein